MVLPYNGILFSIKRNKVAWLFKILQARLTCLRVRKQQLELDMEQQTGSKQEKEYIKAVYCHPAHLTYMRSTS